MSAIDTAGQAHVGEIRAAADRLLDLLARVYVDPEVRAELFRALDRQAALAVVLRGTAVAIARLVDAWRLDRMEEEGR